MRSPAFVVEWCSYVQCVGKEAWVVPVGYYITTGIPICCFVFKSLANGVLPVD